MKITDKYIFFYTEWPSNFKSTSFEWEAFGEKHKFFCTEQAFMWAKAKYFGDKDIADRIQKLGTEVHYLGTFEACEKFLQKNLLNNDLLITMGAGDVYLVGEHLLAK